jgi:cytochrome c-type biogenesis protein CcmH
MKLRLLALVAVALLGVVVAIASPAAAQDDPKKPATADQVNAVANKLYCPVCENITLDTCGTAACAQWREEIRLQLDEGKTPAQVIEDFVTRFGDRVVGTPVDPVLRALSLLTPWLLGALSILGAVWYLRHRDLTAAAEPATARPTYELQSDESYRARLEHDLARLR